MLNKVQIIGNLGNDPEVRYAQSGSAIATISVATTEKWKDKDGNSQERTEWHRVKFFGKLAEIVEKYLSKGSKVYVEGSLRTEKYTDKEGVEKYTTDIIANEMKMLDGKRGGDGDSQGEERPQRSQAPARGAPAPAGGRPAQRPATGGGGGSRGANAARSAQNQDELDDVPFIRADSTW